MAISWEKRQARKLQWTQHVLQDKDEGPDLMLVKFSFFGIAFTLLTILKVVCMVAAVVLVPYILWHYPWVMGAMLAGSAWPATRLMYLNNHNHILEHEGVINPRFQRVLAYVAFGFLAFAVTFTALAHHYYTSLYAAAGVSALGYTYITYYVFEFSVPHWVQRAREWLVYLYEGAGAILALFLLMIVMILPQTEASKEDDEG